MKKIDLKFQGIGKMLEKEEMKNIKGGYSGGQTCYVNGHQGYCYTAGSTKGCYVPGYMFVPTNNC